MRLTVPGRRRSTGKRNSANFRVSLPTFLVSRGKDVETIQELLRHASTTLDLYSQALDPAKLAAKEEIAVAIRSSAAAAD